jgi:hypothetical protein
MVCWILETVDIGELLGEVAHVGFRADAGSGDAFDHDLGFKLGAVAV